MLFDKSPLYVSDTLISFALGYFYFGGKRFKAVGFTYQVIKGVILCTPQLLMGSVLKQQHTALVINFPVIP